MIVVVYVRKLLSLDKREGDTVLCVFFRIISYRPNILIEILYLFIIGADRGDMSLRGFPHSFFHHICFSVLRLERGTDPKLRLAPGVIFCIDRISHGSVILSFTKSQKRVGEEVELPVFT